MTLRQFIAMFVCHNSIIRLWTTKGPGHAALFHIDDETGLSVFTAMEWDVLQGTSWMSQFLDCKVIGVTDILCMSYPEAINIVIEVPQEDG